MLNFSLQYNLTEVNKVLMLACGMGQLEEVGTLGGWVSVGQL